MLAESLGSNACMSNLEPGIHAFIIQRRGDGALVVRVPSRSNGANRLPDAAFAFRAGDPQYSFWEQEYSRQQGRQG
jgi:hypothetical protein